MNILLDTHFLLWVLLDQSRLRPTERTSILDSNNTIYVSTVSFWEISLKYALGKISFKEVMPEDLLPATVQSGFTVIELDGTDAGTFYQLPRLEHSDPFDRMLVWQAIQRRFHLLSRDRALEEYKKFGLQIITA